uniref:RxLR effector candidate protein n=1 Tax=Hyaloperonospora arabidopsidis (strain Emoy2) TaxID=559515 RepID=M4C0H2_HYAAE|nr:RxLR effector candidate protein [Hyaloperonospora arabidopsidis Emoy2]
MRPFYLFALFLSATFGLVMADVVSASREVVATTPGDDERASTAIKKKGLLRVDSPDVNQLEERFSPFESLATMFTYLIKPFQPAFTKLKQLFAKAHGTTVRGRPTSTTLSYRDLVNVVLLKMVHKSPPHTALLSSLRSEFVDHTFDVRLTTAAKVVLTKDFCKFLVSPRPYLSHRETADLSVIVTLRNYLSEFELAILISRAVEKMPHTATPVQCEQFRVWRDKDKTPQRVMDAFRGQLPLLSEPGFKEPSPFLPGDKTILDKIASDYAAFLGSRKELTNSRKI